MNYTLHNVELIASQLPPLLVVLVEVTIEPLNVSGIAALPLMVGDQPPTALALPILTGEGL